MQDEVSFKYKEPIIKERLHKELAKAMIELSSSLQVKEESGGWFDFSKYKDRILDNAIVSINNVHIRLED